MDRAKKQQKHSTGDKYLKHIFLKNIAQDNFTVHIEVKLFRKTKQTRYFFFSCLNLNNVQMSQREHRLHRSNSKIHSFVSLRRHKLRRHAKKCLSSWSTPQCISATGLVQHGQGKNKYKYSNVVERDH